MINYSFKKLFLLAALLTCGIMAQAQLPNEKSGKPSDLEWEFVGWGDAINADAIILCKTMKITYELSDQISAFNQSDSDLGADNITDFSKNQIDDSNILVKYEVMLRTKILKPEGAKHANIDITYYDVANEKKFMTDDVTDMKIRVFSKNEKGKIEKRNVKATGFAKERVDNNYMVMHVTVPDVKAGDIVEYQYNINSTRPLFLYDWVFQESIPTVRSKCDINIPAFLQFNMNVPINKLIKSSVEAGRLAYDVNRSDLKRGKTCVTNHYKIVGDYILPTGEEIANLTSMINMPHVTHPAYLPKGATHLRVK